ncbi:uncharacterized protein [Nicotiana sylvestris]|uniref:uncharacterized protein n=1 Tax=Nicotiana sylvestris TaxID=4096 RepID=UPI00388C50AF
MANDNGNQAIPMVTANATTSRTPALAPAEKLENFFGIDFKCWQQKMFFYLTTLCIKKFIKEDIPDLPDETLENESFLVIEAWNHSDFLCKNYILRGLDDNLYNVYSGVETSKELWNALEKKYKTEDAGMKKFVAAKFFDYKMVDSKSVITQVQELQVIIHDLLAEDNKKRKKASGPKYNPSKKRFNRNCYNCGKTGHKSTECRARKKNKKRGQENMVEKHDDVDDLCAMLSKCNLVGNPKEWWIDSGATRHVCAVREAFSTYASARPEETLSMGNAATANIEGYGKIFLKMTSAKQQLEGLGALCITVNLVIYDEDIKLLGNYSLEELS